MKALIRIKDSTDIITEPFPDWLDPVAFSVFDCYGYAACNDYVAPDPEAEPARFTFEEKEIANPFRKDDDDPATVIRHFAHQITEAENGDDCIMINGKRYTKEELRSLIE